MELLKKIRAILFCFLLLPFVSQAQTKVWGMQDCIEYALDNNIPVKQTELNSEVQRINNKQYKLSQLPTLNGSASHNYNFGRSVDPFTYDFTNSEIQSSNLSLNANLTIFNGLTLRHEIKQSNFDYLAGMEDLDRAKNELTVNVASAYLAVIYATENKMLAEKRLSSAKESRDRTKKLVDAGSVAQGSFYDEESAVATEELNLVQAENAHLSAVIDLMQLMNLDYSPEFTVESPKVELPDQSALALSAQEVYDVATATLPELRSSAYKVQSAESGLSARKGGRYPRLSIFGSLNTGYSSLTQRPVGSPVFGGYSPTQYVTSGGDQVLQPYYTGVEYDKVNRFDQFEDNYNKSVGVSLSIPIFNGWSTEANVQRSKINLENARYNDELTRQDLYKKVVQAHANALSSQKRYEAAERSKVAMNESFGYAQKRYELGALSSIEFLKSRDNLDAAESEFLQAKYEFIFRIKALDYYLGRPLVF